MEDVVADGVDAAIVKHAVEPECEPELAGLMKDIEYGPKAKKDLQYIKDNGWNEFP